MSEQRVQKILARAGVASRRAAEEIITQGRVTVNGRIAVVGDKADPDRDAIKVDGRRVRKVVGHRYLLLHKPQNVMSTRSDPEGRPTVFDLIPPGLRKALVTVGRLDFHSDGLILLTDDGELAHRVAHPSFGCSKTYEVKVKGVPADEKIARLRRGVVIEGRRTAPARISSLRRPRPHKEEVNSWWTVELQEGRPRQIREMFFRIGHPVQRLTRVAIGPISDPRLTPGAYRELRREEIEALAGSGGTPGPRRRSGRRSS